MNAIPMLHPGIVGVVACAVTMTSGVTLGATLEISQVADRARLRWSTNDAGFRLQFSPRLSAGNNWLTFPLAAHVNGDQFELSLLNAGDPGRYFRLLQPGDNPPTLALVNPPVTLPVGARADFEISYGDADGDLVLLEMIRSDVASTNHTVLPASLIGLGGTSGASTLSIDSRNLALGTHAFQLRLHDSTGNRSPFVTFETEVTGVAGGGTAPTLTLPTSGEPASYTRPAGPLNRTRPAFPVSWSDPDGDLSRVRIVTVSPGNRTNVIEESAGALGLTGASGTVRVPFLTFTSTNLLGNYTVELTGIDRNGNVGPAAARTVALSGFSIAALGLNLSSFSPASGPAGTVVSLNGSYFEPTAVSNVVELNGLEVPILGLTNSATTLLVEIPEGAETGPFIVRKPTGVAAVTTTMFVVPPSVVVLTESDPGTNEFTEAFTLRPGASMQLRTRVVPVGQGGDRTVDWFVNGVPGGNATVGTITSAGLFTASTVAPATGSVTVSAALRSSPGVTGALNLEIVDSEPLPGEPKLVRAATGGEVHSRAWRAAVTIPPGALNGDTTVSVREATLPAGTPPGTRLLGAAEFLPAGTVFASPVQATIPLNRVRTPGTVLPVFIHEPLAGSFLDEGLQAVVIEPGDLATVSLPQFTVVVVAEPAGAPAGPPPVISSIEPVSAREGELIPVRLTGTGLSADLRAEFLNSDGTPATDLQAVTYLGRDTEGGVLVEIRSIDNFSGGLRPYRLRLSRSDGGAAEINFNVEGLPELIVGSGQQLDFTDPSPMVVSGVRVYPGGLLRVLSGKLDIESTGEVVINGRIDAAGAPGGSAVGQQAGLPGEMGHGGRGGLGREDSEGFLGLDGAEPENYGHNGNDAVGYSRPEQGASRPRGPGDLRPRGIGGPAGANLELDPLGLVAKVIECIGTAGTACIDAAISLAEQIRSVVNIIDGGGPGRRGYGAVASSALDETGGGGGGGGGMIEITLNVADLLDALELNVDLPIFDYVGIRLLGGGGGAGGDGGRDVALKTRRTIILGAGAEVSVAGGDGGNGSSEGTMVINSSALDFTVPVPVPVLPGGGGGGGRGGSLTVTAGLGVQRSSPDQFKTHGGAGGIGGVPFLDPEDRESRWQTAGAGDADGPLGRRFVNGPLLDPATYRPAVTSRQLLTLQGINIVQSSGAGGYQPLPIEVRVRGAAPGAERTFAIHYDPQYQRYRGNILLHQGWNTLSGGRLIDQTVLVISSDADGDGLSDDDELDLGTDPNVADSDGDSLGDGEELVSNGDPLRADTDGDGLTDGAEHALGTALNRRDTDADGAWDSAEALFATDPNSAASRPLEIPTGTFLSAASHLATTGGAYLGAFNGTGQFGLLGRPAGGFGFGLAADKDGELFIADGPRLATYDPVDQLVAEVGEFAAGGAIQCATLTFNPVDGFLYGVELGGAPNFANTGQLLRIDRKTGLATRLGALQSQPIRALACDVAGQLFAALDSGAVDILVQLDAATGTLTQNLGTINVAPITGMAFDRTGALFAVSPISATSSSLLSVNPANAQAAQVTLVARNLSGLVVMPCPAPCVSFAGASPGWFRPTKLRSADFDLDGDDDLVLLAARDSSLIRSSVTLLQSAGNGSFTVAVNHPLSSPPNTITGDELVVARLNGDAPPDVIARNVFTAPASVAVFLNSGGVIFPEPAYPATGIDPRSLDVGDLNGDAIPDLVAVGDGVLLTYAGDGLGGFGAGTAPFALDPGWFLLAVRLGDVDGDHDLDLVALDSAALLISLNNGAGGFAPPVPRVITYEDNGVEVADVNGDGRLDVVTVVVGQDGGFNVYLSQGNGQMADPVFNSFAAGLSGNLVQDFVLGDLNDDDLPDLAFAEYTGAAVHLWIGQGDGTFKPHRKGPLPTMSGRPPLTVTIGDYNGDGQPDLAAGVLTLNQIWSWLSQ